MATAISEITAAQKKVLEVVDKNGSSMLSAQTQPRLNRVHNGAARALVAKGILRSCRGSDGIFVERA